MCWWTKWTSNVLSSACTLGCQHGHWKQSKVADPNPFPLMNIYHSKKPDPYLLAIIPNSTVSIPPNPCATSCIYKPRNLFQFSSASTLKAVYLVPFCVFTCVMLCSSFGAEKIFSTDGSLKKRPFWIFLSIWMQMSQHPVVSESKVRWISLVLSLVKENYKWKYL